VVTEDHTEVFTGFGEVGVRAEPVARCAAAEARDYIESGVPLGIYLADQMLVPMAIARGGRLRTGPLSRHTTTNIDEIRRFLDVHIRVEEDSVRSRIVSFLPR
jgi:RNA 3'-terminal phosphate cyclase (ATP)